MSLISIKIVENDVDAVAKIILLDEKNRVLMLKRSRYTKKYAKKWDFPGGHLKKNETLESGLKREVKEETGITINKSSFIKKDGNINFFWGKYNSEKIELSFEHTDYTFMEKRQLDPDDKFQTIAIELLENL